MTMIFTDERGWRIAGAKLSGIARSGRLSYEAALRQFASLMTSRLLTKRRAISILLCVRSHVNAVEYISRREMPANALAFLLRGLRFCVVSLSLLCLAAVAARCLMLPRESASALHYISDARWGLF